MEIRPCFRSTVRKFTVAMGNDTITGPYFHFMVSLLMKRKYNFKVLSINVFSFVVLTLAILIRCVISRVARSVQYRLDVKVDVPCSE